MNSSADDRRADDQPDEERKHGTIVPGGMMQTDAFARPSGGMADTTDSKSVARKGVWVRIPPRAPTARAFDARDNAR